MAYREMMLFRWTKEGVATRREKGMSSLRDDWKAIAETSGARLQEFVLFSGYSEWDGMFIVESDQPQSAAQFANGHAMARAEGAIESAQVVRLVSPEDFDKETTARIPFTEQ